MKKKPVKKNAVEKELQRKSAAKNHTGTNKFNNFENHSYDMSDLERKLLQQ